MSYQGSGSFETCFGLWDLGWKEFRSKYVCTYIRPRKPDSGSTLTAGPNRTHLFTFFFVSAMWKYGRDDFATSIPTIQAVERIRLILYAIISAKQLENMPLNKGSVNYLFFDNTIWNYEGAIIGLENLNSRSEEKNEKIAQQASAFGMRFDDSIPEVIITAATFRHACAARSNPRSKDRFSTSPRSLAFIACARSSLTISDVYWIDRDRYL